MATPPKFSPPPHSKMKECVGALANDPITGHTERVYEFRDGVGNTAQPVPDKITCRVCGKTKDKKYFSKTGRFQSDSRKKICRPCDKAYSKVKAAERRAEIEACRARGDGYDLPCRLDTLPDEAKLMLGMVRAAVTAASCNRQGITETEFLGRQRKESIEWLLTLDVIDCDEGLEGLPRYTFGYVRATLMEYGVDLPPEGVIKAKLAEWAANAGYEIEWNALPVPERIRYYGLGEVNSGYAGRGASSIGLIAAWW